MARASEQRKRSDPGLRALACAIECEAYYRQTARAVLLQRASLDGALARLLAHLALWRVAPRERFFQFDDSDAW